MGLTHSKCASQSSSTQPSPTNNNNNNNNRRASSSSPSPTGAPHRGATPWIPDSSTRRCQHILCSRPFGLFTRRHHCRSCGRIFCARCTSYRRDNVKGYPADVAVRVCRQCSGCVSGSLRGLPSSRRLDALNNNNNNNNHNGAGGGSNDVANNMSMPSRHESTLRWRKLCLLGARGVGKTALITQYFEHTFSPVYLPSVTTTATKQILMRGQEFSLSVLDTAGVDECSDFQPQYSIGTHGYVIVYAVDDAAGLEMAKQLRSALLECYASGVTMVLVGTKADVPASQRVVSSEEGHALAEMWCCPYVECSAATGSCVERMFAILLESIQLQENVRE
uniref:Rheb2b n=1 Tax=Prokinetoplastina sp. TaxID=2152669 RepID=A0A2R4IKY5_9EUGL|nr:Rheb2b [Prokinetoplastina sp.]|eukprot:PhM_4_TR11995/c0_g1_i1/m.63799/K07208/RHEB; Ras homolog enriched in brain